GEAIRAWYGRNQPGTIAVLRADWDLALFGVCRPARICRACIRAARRLRRERPLSCPLQPRRCSHASPLSEPAPPPAVSRWLLGVIRLGGHPMKWLGMLFLSVAIMGCSKESNNRTAEPDAGGDRAHNPPGAIGQG